MKEFLIKYKLIIGGVTAGICTIALLTAVFLPYFVNVSAPIIDEGKNMINNASTVDYQDNEIFGRLCLEGIQELMIHNINFPLKLRE